MEFYKELIVFILERSVLGEEEEKLLKILKSGIDLNYKERTELRELIENRF